MTVDLRLGDCLEIMPTLAAQSYDAIIADIPYGTTACKWDTVIPFVPMWAELKRLAKPRAAIVLFGSQPFTSALVMSNPQWFKWEDIWHKSQATGHLNCKVMPMREHENILVFGSGRVTYNPQIVDKPKQNIRPPSRRTQTDCYGSFNEFSDRTIERHQSYPRSVIEFCNANNGERGDHPTQKPVALMEYLIRTYTNEGDAVLDFTMGSGTTMVACVNTKRNGTGIEKDAGYFAIAQRRIQEAQAQMAMPMVTA